MAVTDEFSDCDTDVQLGGKVAIVTGATSGIGLEVAKNLAQRGAKVIIASRNETKLEDVRKGIIESTGNPNIVARKMDFESLASIRTFVDTTVRTEPRVDILINNIGSIGLGDRLTVDHLHVMMQVNYFGMFLLTYLLFPTLKASAPSRVVNISSKTLVLGQLEFDHWNDVGRYLDFGIYSNAKLATVLFTAEMDRRVKRTGVSVYSIDPGIVDTDAYKRHHPLIKPFTDIVVRLFGKRADRAATVPVFVAIDPKVSDKGGKHFEKCKEVYSSWFVDDKRLTRTLWDKSKKAVKISKEEDWEDYL